MNFKHYFPILIMFSSLTGQGIIAADLNNQIFPPYETVEAKTDGVPVYSLDNMMYTYGVGPDLFPGIVMQDENPNPIVKLKLKKSWEIGFNYLGSCTQQVPRSPEHDIQPFLPIHLIDGDPETIWSSFGSIRPDARPEWIRIDLPIETTVASVSLMISKNNPFGGDFGRALPTEMTVKLSRDAWHWETVYEKRGIDSTGKNLDISFSPRPAKQIWIEANGFEKKMRGGPYAFSFGELKVNDPKGNNVALVSRGAGVTVSSTNHTHMCDRLSQESLWGPIQYDMGMKWVRIIGLDYGAHQWTCTETKPGVYEFDRVLDKWITDATSRGVNLVMGLEPQVINWNYENPPRKVDWEDARYHGIPRISDWEKHLWIDTSPEMTEAYLRYVDYMVKHFKGRAHIYEVGNEWSSVPWNDTQAARFMKVFEKTYEAVKKADPDARVMLGNPINFNDDMILTFLGQPRLAGVHDGKLMASGGALNDPTSWTLAINESVNARDVQVSVDALNRGEFGIVLRYENPDNFLLAGVNPGRIYLAERTSAGWSISEDAYKQLGPNGTDMPSTEVHLSARVEGNKATMTISDGTFKRTASHTITNKNLNKSGAVGLVQLTGANQTFDDFQVGAIGESKTADPMSMKESFSGASSDLPSGWKFAKGPYTRNPIPSGWASKIDGVGWHPYASHDAAYYRALRKMERECEQLGFRA